MFNNLINYVKENDFIISVFSDKIHIFNYESLLDISKKEIVVKINKQLYKICGEDLIIKKLDKKEILIVGEFKRIETK